jgi:hypothetical protein
MTRVGWPRQVEARDYVQPMTDRGDIIQTNPTAEFTADEPGRDEIISTC